MQRAQTHTPSLIDIICTRRFYRNEREYILPLEFEDHPILPRLTYFGFLEKYLKYETFVSKIDQGFDQSWPRNFYQQRVTVYVYSADENEIFNCTECTQEFSIKSYNAFKEHMDNQHNTLATLKRFSCQPLLDLQNKPPPAKKYSCDTCLTYMIKKDRAIKDHKRPLEDGVSRCSKRLTKLRQLAFIFTQINNDHTAQLFFQQVSVYFNIKNIFLR